MSGSLRLDDTGGILTGTLDLASSLVGAFDSSRRVELTESGNTLGGQAPVVDTLTEFVAGDGTRTLWTLFDGNSRIDILGLSMNSQASISHYTIYVIQLLLGLDLSGGQGGQTITVIETFELTDVTVVEDPEPPIPPVPLPASAPLLLAGLGAVFALRRRQRG